MTSRPMLCTTAPWPSPRSSRSCGHRGDPRPGRWRAAARRSAAPAGGPRGRREAPASLEARVLDHLRRRHRARRALGQRPASVPLDADRHRLVALAIEVGEDRRGGRQRHLVLARAATVDDADAKTFLEGEHRQSRMSNCQFACSLHRCLPASRSVSRIATGWPGAGRSRRRTGRSRRRCSCRSARAAPSGVLPRDLAEMAARIVLANTYHLYLRPGDDLIADTAACIASSAGPDRSSPTAAATRSSASVPLPDHRGGRPLPIASRRLRAPADAGEGRRHPGAARPRHRDGARRVHGVPGQPRRRRALARTDAAMGARARDRFLRLRRGRRTSCRRRPGRPSSASSRAASTRTCGGKAPRRHRESASSPTPSAGSASASRST